MKDVYIGYLLIFIILLIPLYDVIQRLIPTVCPKCGLKKAKYRTFHIKGSGGAGGYFRCEKCLTIFHNRNKSKSGLNKEGV